MHTEPPCLVARGGYHTSCAATANGDRPTPQSRIVALFYGRIESVHVDVDDAPLSRSLV